MKYLCIENFNILYICICIENIDFECQKQQKAYEKYKCRTTVNTSNTVCTTCPEVIYCKEISYTIAATCTGNYH